MFTRAEAGKTLQQRCLESLSKHLPQAVRRYRIAFSGGLDSTVLVHCLAAAADRLPAMLDAVHVDHGLHPDSSDWARHCRDVCERLGIPISTRKVDARAGRGESPEAAARASRYAVFAELIDDGDCLLTAHHQDDQAETLLLQLLRGAGPHGLAAMPFVERFAAGWHCRPLLEFSREELARYAASHALQWIEDPANFDTGLRRNYLRREIFPRLKRYWPAAARTLSRSAAHNAAAARLLDELARADHAAISGAEPGTLSVAGLSSLDRDRQANVLREWLYRLGLPLPAAVHLERLREDVLAAAADSAPLLAWPGAEVRRYRDLLYAMPPMQAFESVTVTQWSHFPAPLDLPRGGRMVAHSTIGRGLRTLEKVDGTVSIRYRRGGERCRPAGRGASHALKKLLQESAIPPWRRDRLPLVHVGDELAVVPGLCVCEGWRAQPGESGFELEFIGLDDDMAAQTRA